MNFAEDDLFFFEPSVSAEPLDKTVHVSVMLTEVLDQLRATKGGNFLDCTFGGGGHSRALLDANPKSRVLAIDRDQRAVKRAERLIAEYSGRLEVQHASFADLPSIVEGQIFDGILADLGLSTDQLKGERGFSFNDQASLDMRMDESQDSSAYNVVNETGEQELYVLFREGGVGPEARAVARAIVAARPITSTPELSKIINRSLHGKVPKGKTNPSTVVFQAIRIAVNDELGQVDQLLEVVPKVVTPNSRLAVICFHSLEDKAVARCMRKWEGGDAPPPGWRGPVQAEKPLGRVLTRKAMMPSLEEVERNPNSRSARLRVFEFR